MTDYEGLRVVRHGAVAEIELCRPELLNRIDQQVHAELIEVLAELAPDPEIRAVVFTSTGRAFSAGGDTDTMLVAAGDVGNRITMIDQGREIFRSFADFPKPLVVALHGDVYGVGTTLVLLSDAIVATAQVKIADPHVRMGLVAGDGGIVGWPMNMGIVKAKRHLLTGDPISGEEAHRLGIVSDLVDETHQVRSVAFELAERMADLPPLAVQLTKRALNKVVAMQAAATLDYSIFLEALSFGTEDLHEAVAAFRERRPGHWRGR